MESDNAILLRKTKLTESSLIVTWLTEQHGKIKTVAKGARRPKSPFTGRLDLFFSAEITFARSARSDLHALREVALRDTRDGLRRGYEAMRAAAYVVELAELTTEPDQAVPEMYDLLRRALDFLAAKEATHRAVLHFERELSKLLGLTGQLNTEADPAAAISRLAGSLPPDRGKLLQSLRAGAASGRAVAA